MPRLAKLKHNTKPTAAAARAVNTKDYLVTEKGIDRFAHHDLHRHGRRADGNHDPDPRWCNQSGSQRHARGRERSEGCASYAGEGKKQRRKPSSRSTNEAAPEADWVGSQSAFVLGSAARRRRRTMYSRDGADRSMGGLRQSPRGTPVLIRGGLRRGWTVLIGPLTWLGGCTK